MICYVIDEKPSSTAKADDPPKDTLLEDEDQTAEQSEHHEATPIKEVRRKIGSAIAALHSHPSEKEQRFFLLFE